MLQAAVAADNNSSSTSDLRRGRGETRAAASKEANTQAFVVRDLLDDRARKNGTLVEVTAEVVVVVALTHTQALVLVVLTADVEWHLLVSFTCTNTISPLVRYQKWPLCPLLQ